MKITDIQCYPVWGGGRNFFFVVVDTDEGIYGVGEAGLTGRELAVAGRRRALQDRSSSARTRRRIEHLWQLMFRGGFFPAGKIACSAIVGHRHRPLGHQGQGARRARSTTCWAGSSATRSSATRTSGAPAIEDARRERQAARRRRAGSSSAGACRRPAGDVLEPGRAIRAAPSRSSRRCARRSATRSSSASTSTPASTRRTRSGSAAPSSTTAPSSSRTRSARRACSRCACVRQHVAVPLAVGEQFAGKWEFRQMIEEELIDYARIDLCIVGGLTEAKKIAGWCETHYIKLATHNPLGPGLQRRLPAPQPGLHQRRRPGAAAPAGRRC